MAAKMDKEEDGSSYVRLQVAITDPLAIQKVLDKRYLTGSVGGRAGKAICSVSGDDFASESSDGRPKLAKYKRGQVYKGKLAFVDMQDISFKEYSFVNQPADGKSGVRKSSTGNVKLENSSSDWVAKSSAFVLNMQEEDIYSIEEHKSILKGLKRKESKPLYLHLKGAFLTAMAVQESETYMDSTSSLLSKQENKESFNMEQNTQEDNVLDVIQSLVQDLAPVKDDLAEKPASEEKIEDLEESNDSVKNESSESEDKVSNDNSEKADEQPNEVVDSEKAEEPKEESKEILTETQEQPQEEAPLNSEQNVATENESSELLEKVRALEEDNAKLKNALHNTLVERVVDAKISVGLESADNRQSAIEDHKNRSASSLADSLRDMAKMPQQKNAKAEMPEITSETEVVEGEKNAITFNDKVEEEKADEKATYEQLLVDTLMGRRKL